MWPVVPLKMANILPEKNSQFEVMSKISGQTSLSHNSKYRKLIMTIDIHNKSIFILLVCFS